jgi:hypothetical protein
MMWLSAIPVLTHSLITIIICPLFFVVVVVVPATNCSSYYNYNYYFISSWDLIAFLHLLYIIKAIIASQYYLHSKWHILQPYTCHTWHVSQSQCIIFTYLRCDLKLIQSEDKFYIERDTTIWHKMVVYSISITVVVLLYSTGDGNQLLVLL